MPKIEQRSEFETKENWSLDRKNDIAHEFGYAPDETFAQALRRFIEEMVKDAKLTQFLPIFAQNYFRSHQPPLTEAETK